MGVYFSNKREPSEVELLCKEEFSKRLRVRRGKRKQTEIAKILEVYQSTYSAYENAHRLPQEPAIIERIESFLGETIDGIIAEVMEKHKAEPSAGLPISENKDNQVWYGDKPGSAPQQAKSISGATFKVKVNGQEVELILTGTNFDPAYLGNVLKQILDIANKKIL